MRSKHRKNNNLLIVRVMKNQHLCRTHQLELNTKEMKRHQCHTYSQAGSGNDLQDCMSTEDNIGIGYNLISILSEMSIRKMPDNKIDHRIIPIVSFASVYVI